MIPKVAGMSQIQRNGKKVFDPIKNGSDEVVFISDRNHVFGVTMSIEHYKELLKAAQQLEDEFWMGASESAMDFWMDKSNDVYEKCL